MPASNRAPALAALLTVTCSLIVFAAETPVARLPCTLLLVGYLPGWTFLRAVTRRDWQGLEAVVMIISLSFALTLIGGIPLHLMGAITRTGWLVWLNSVVLIGAAVWAARGGAGSGEEARQLTSLSAWQAQALSASRASVWSGVTAFLITAAATLVAVQSAVGQHPFSYTELWIKPASETPAASTIVGLSNHEGKPARYRLELSVDGQIVEVWSRIELAHGETWTAPYERPGIGIHPRTVVTAYKDGVDDRVYRRAWMAASTDDEKLVQMEIRRPNR